MSCSIVLLPVCNGQDGLEDFSLYWCVTSVSSIYPDADSKVIGMEKNFKTRDCWLHEAC